MPAPSNTAATSATNISSLPATISQDVHDAGTTYSVWYKYTAQAGDDDIGVWGFGGTPGSGYQPTTEVYLGPDTAPVLYQGGYFAFNKPIVVNVTPGTTYYFKFTTNSGNPSPANLSLSVLRAAATSATAGKILITEFGWDGDATLVDPASGAVVGYRRLLGPSDQGDVLTSGIFAVGNGNDETVDVYAANFTNLAQIAATFNSSTDCITSNRVNRFYFCHTTSGVSGVVRTVSDAGVEGGTTWSLPSNSRSMNGMAVNRAETILYYGGTTNTIHRFDLVGNAPLSDLVASASSRKDMFCLPDGSVLAVFATTVSRYSAAGSLIQTYGPFTGYDRIFLDTNDLYLWVETQGSTIATFRKIRISDGAVLSTVTTPIFNAGVAAAAVATTMERFGVSNSCPLLVLPSTTPPTVSLPNSVPCCADPCSCAGGGGGSVSPGSTGPILPPTTTAWTPTCTGGGNVPAAADLTNSEDWSASAIKTPCFRFTFHLAKYPASDGTTTYYWSQRPLADTSAWSEGRLVGFSDIRRSSTDQDGNMEVSKWSVQISDDDALIRGLLATEGTRYFHGREGVLEVLSEAGRASGLAWRVVARGRVVSVQASAGRTASVELADVVGSRFSGFDLEKTFGTFLGDEHTALPEASKGRLYPMIVGEHSDDGAVDVNGNPAAKGLLPVIDTGDYNISGAVSPPPPQYAAPPVITASGVVGAAGGFTIYYGATVITPFGESLMSNIVAVTGVSSRNVSNYNYISGTFDSGDPAGLININKVRIWTGPDANTMTHWLDEAHYNGVGVFGYFDGAAPFPGPPTRDELDVPKQMNPPVVSTALQSTDVWGRLVVSKGYSHVRRIFWSDLANGTQPKRVLADPALEGVEWMTADSPGWPHATRYLELTNPITGETIRQTVIYVRGNRLTAHRNGDVTIAVNACGMEDVGDGTGTMVDEAFLAGQLFLNEHILKNQGTGYLNGNYGPLETFTNGNAQLMTSAWAAAQAITVNRIGGLGYLAAWAIHEPMTVREWVRRFCLSFDCRLAVNQFGQIRPIVIDDLATLGTGRRYRERVERVQLLEQPLKHEETENRITYNFDWDSDAKMFRVTNQVLRHEQSIAAHVPGGVVGDPNPQGIHEGPVQNLYFVRDDATVTDSRARRLTRNGYAPRYPRHAQGLVGLETDMGDHTLLTHRDGLGASGDVDTDLIVLEHIVRATYGEIETELVGLDVYNLLNYSATMTASTPEMTSSNFRMP